MVSILPNWGFKTSIYFRLASITKVTGNLLYGFKYPGGKYIGIFLSPNIGWIRSTDVNKPLPWKGSFRSNEGAITISGGSWKNVDVCEIGNLISVTVPIIG